MLISHQKKFIFLKRYKCASTSIENIFGQVADVKGTQHYPYYHHTHLVPLQRHFEEMGWDWNEYFVFTILRNPKELLKSLYCYGLPDKKGWYWWERHWDEVSRDIYSPRQRDIPPDLVDFNQWVLEADFSRFKLDSFIYDAHGNLAVHFMIKVESLSIDILTVAERFGIEIKDIPHLNKTPRQEQGLIFSDTALKKVEQVFSTDLLFGGYKLST